MKERGRGEGRGEGARERLRLKCMVPPPFVLASSACR